MIEAERLAASRPFIIYSGTDVSGTVGGNPSVQSYCGLDYTAASRYRLDRPDHNQIFQFFGNILGSQNKLVYCLDKFADGPYNDVPYESRPFETLFPGATERQKEMLGWILANTFPAVSAADTFALVGVDPTSAPVLDNNDAYAAVQISLWVLLGQIALDEVKFLDCTSGETHPKSDRLRTTVLELLRLAGQFVDNETPPEVSINQTNPSCGLSSFLSCCNKSILPSDGSSPYLVFANCPNEVRTICGRLLIGPFRIISSFAGQPTITVTPFCNCGEDYSVSFMDFCGNPISNPVIGQEFYIAVRTCKRFSCFTITASFTGNITRVITLEPQSTALNYQPIGTSFEDQSITLNAEICICVEQPTTAESSFERNKFGININNNNNNNNNNSSNNGGGYSGQFPCIPICYPIWQDPRPPYPPYPPYPPEPPYPPYPPYPPCPPEPPCPPYPPEPPYPPCPPYPPEPPCPPYPPEPPCPPYPPEPPCPPCPPCKPEPPCRLEPPCKPEPPCRPEPPCKSTSACNSNLPYKTTAHIKNEKIGNQLTNKKYGF